MNKKVQEVFAIMDIYQKVWPRAVDKPLALIREGDGPKTFTSYGAAVDYMKELKPGYYQIEKIFFITDEK